MVAEVICCLHALCGCSRRSPRFKALDEDSARRTSNRGGALSKTAEFAEKLGRKEIP
jgi:hypothetical protein